LLLLESIAKFFPQTKVLVISDALPANAVRAMLRLQASEIASSASTASDIVELSGRLMNVVPEGPVRKNQSWVITGAVGGAGATTLAIELACATATHDPESSVCLI